MRTERFADGLPFVRIPTLAVRREMVMLVIAKKFDAFSTVLVFSHPDLVEVVPFTRLLVDTFGVVAGVTLASLLGIAGVLVAAEVSHRTCKKTRALIGASTAPYPYIEYHTAYFLASALFLGAFSWNISLLV